MSIVTILVIISSNIVPTVYYNVYVQGYSSVMYTVLYSVQCERCTVYTVRGLNVQLTSIPDVSLK